MVQTEQNESFCHSPQLAVLKSWNPAAERSVGTRLLGEGGIKETTEEAGDDRELEAGSSSSDHIAARK